MQTVPDGLAYIDVFLAIEGFKTSAEHLMSRAHLRKVTRGTPIDDDTRENIREAALALYKHFVEPLKLDDALVKQFLIRVHSEKASERLFDQLQTKVCERMLLRKCKIVQIYDVLTHNPLFYPGFQRSALYAHMLVELDLPKHSGAYESGVDGERVRGAHAHRLPHLQQLMHCQNLKVVMK
jgi:hypothetical protein